MATAPAFQVYARDELADSQLTLLSSAAFGVFERLRRYAWVEGGVPDQIPNPVRTKRFGIWLEAESPT